MRTKKQKKPTKLEELEERIKALEAVSHKQYIAPCPYPHYPPQQPPFSPQNPYEQQKMGPGWIPPTVIC
jgi:hypothetical protein